MDRPWGHAGARWPAYAWALAAHGVQVDRAKPWRVVAAQAPAERNLAERGCFLPRACNAGSRQMSYGRRDHGEVVYRQIRA